MKRYLIFSMALMVGVSMNNAYSANEEAIFGGGCFWCMEPPFDALPGVISTTSGYTGGSKLNPTYQDVTGGDSGHYEVIKVVFDPKIVSYQKILDVFWKNIDPYDDQGQFCDKGQQYLSGIFYANEKQNSEAQASKIKLDPKGKYATKLIAAEKFYPAEDNHQDYYKKNPIKYKFYRFKCGRDKRLKEIWEK